LIQSSRFGLAALEQLLPPFDARPKKSILLILLIHNVSAAVGFY